jgi:hypothetical protein
VTEQINYISDVVRGLTSRPATLELGVIPNKSETAYRLTEVQFDGVWFIMGYRPGDIVMWGLDGTEYTVVEGPGTAPLDYIGDDMRPYVFNDSLFIVNRAKVVAKAADPLPPQSPSNVGVLYSLGGALYESFGWRIVYEDGTIASAAYNTAAPNSPGAGDYLSASAPRIALGLLNSMNASVDLKPSTTLTRVNGTIGIVDDTTSFSMEVSDPGGGLLRAFTTSLEDVEDLSETAPHGMVVKINNSDQGTEDDFYMRFKSETATVIGTGIGSTGVWEEWFNEEEVSTFDLSTMPHVIEKTGPTEFTLGEGDWYGRRTGDAETNPFSDFLGHAIRDIGGFQSRLVLVAGATCAMSQSKNPLDFFKRSVIADIDTDPISIQATSTDGEEVRLDWIIPFDRDIVFMSDPGKGQYIITGSNKATPDNTAIVKTTAFEMKGGAKPVETGKTILFPFTSGSYSGINEFFTNQEVAVNSVNTLTETVTRYIPGEVVQARVSTNFSVACFASDDAATKNTLWIYKYLWQDATKVQSSWSKWVLPTSKARRLRTSRWAGTSGHWKATA